MKVLFVFDCFHGGTGRVVGRLLSFFPPQYELVALGTKKRSIDFPIPGRVLFLEVDCKKKDDESYFTYVKRTSKSIKTVVDYCNPDVVVSFLCCVNTLTCFALWHTHIPLLVSERSNPWQGVGWKFKCLRFIAYLRADCIVVQNSFFINLYKGFFRRKTLVLPNPVPKLNRHFDCQNELENPRIIAIGNLSPWKKHDRMIRLFQEFLKYRPEATLTIYGEGICRDKLACLIHELRLEKRIFLPGHVSDLSDILCRADIFWMTSEREGFPNALCEAMSAGLPCVMFECHRGLRDIIDDGVNGFLIPYNNDNEFIRQTESLCMNSQLRKTIETSAAAIIEKFGDEEVCRKWISIIMNLKKKRK